MYSTGFIIGHFEPLHLGHIRSILHACGQVKDLHIFITPHPQPNPHFNIKLKDKARWLSMALAELPFIHLHLLPDAILPDYEGAPNLLNSQCINDVLAQALSQLHLDTTNDRQPLLFVEHGHPLLTIAASLSGVTLEVTPSQAEFNSSLIGKNPAKYWYAIHPQARSSYTKTVAIVGGESSGKTTLVHKLVNYYGASFALEMGKLFVTSDLGGTELGMQYDDYPYMAVNHAEAIRAATKLAPAPLVIVDTDFVTTQAFCEEYEGKTHPFLSACIDEFRLDFTIMLDNNTPWVADGLRTLGQEEQRSRFAQRLHDIFTRHQIQPFMITDPDYHQRFLQAIDFIEKHVFFNV